MRAFLKGDDTHYTSPTEASSGGDAAAQASAIVNVTNNAVVAVVRLKEFESASSNAVFQWRGSIASNIISSHMTDQALG